MTDRNLVSRFQEVISTFLASNNVNEVAVVMHYPECNDLYYGGGLPKIEGVFPTTTYDADKLAKSLAEKTPNGQIFGIYEKLDRLGRICYVPKTSERATYSSVDFLDSNTQPEYFAVEKMTIQEASERIFVAASRPKGAWHPRA